jgi:hypothetical protein
MRKVYSYFAFILLRAAGAAIEAFQPAHHRQIIRRHQHPSAITITALHSTSENEALKAELSEYLRKREEVNADAAAKT